MAAGWLRRGSSAVEYYLLDLPRFRLVFFTRKGGTSAGHYRSLNLSYDVDDDPDRVRENWTRVRSALAVPTVVTMRQTHSSTVRAARPGDTELAADACFTNEPHCLLTVRVADCLPVYVMAPDGRCAGVAHAGWRGTASRIAERLCHEMAHGSCVPLAELSFALGPCICSRCYVVGEDVRREFAGFPDADRFLSRIGDGRWLLDLREANRRQMLALGLTELPSLDVCTFENDATCYSARRDHVTGRNVAAIAITDRNAGRGYAPARSG